ncbi:MAG: division/cell wall cluster transcriptional repressor MraZ [Proteobacteria bacterium]|nr:division/cell wall cluster transcriptional repressor MraZ [Pseudomonadota bacterium]
MAVFIGTFENKVDRKGRVSVPVQFRQMLAGQSFQGIVAFRSYRVDAIEACGIDFMERLNDSVSSMDLFSDAHDDLAATIFADSRQLPFDGDGRIVLPPRLAEHAGIGERAAFVGKGSIFQIWEPDALEAHKEEARARARSQGLTLPLRPDREDGR